MSVEIERKFLVRNDAWRALATSQYTIRQAYLDENPKISVRVRIRGDNAATLTLKSSPAGLRRLELEYPIPMLEAEALLPLRHGSLIEKTRHIVPCGDKLSDKLAWEVDEFHGENDGLIIAEIELPNERHPVALPPWIGQEITGQASYYNGSLARHPYGRWEQTDAKARTELRR
jgi:adenylate cyclase